MHHELSFEILILWRKQTRQNCRLGSMPHGTMDSMQSHLSKAAEELEEQEQAGHMTAKDQAEDWCARTLTWRRRQQAAA
jgi:hypothetical protein